MWELRWFYYIICVAGATGIEPISTVLETAILTVVLRPYEDAHATDIIAYKNSFFIYYPVYFA